MKIKRIIIACLVSVFGIINVNAASLEITGVSTLKTDENGKYEIKLKDVGSDEFTQVEFEVAYDSNLIKFEGNESSDYSTTPNYSGNKAFIVSANNYKDGVIGAFNITNLSGENATTSFVIKNIKFKKGDVEVGTAADYSKTLTLRQGVTTTTTRPKNTSASVTSLSFKNATMKPAFNQSIHEYKLYTKDTIRQVTLFYTTLETGVTLKSECTVGCTVSSQSDTIIQTIQGKNEVIFKFTSEDEKNTEEYKFIIYRGETTDGSNKLAGLNIKDYNIRFQRKESLQGKVAIDIPIDYLVEKVNDDNNIVLVNDNLGISLIINYSNYSVKKQSFQQFKKGMETEFKKNEMYLEWLEEGSYKSGNKKLFYGTYKTPTGKGDTYNSIFYVEEKNGIVVGNYNCFYKNIDIWAPIIKGTISLIKF